MILQNSDYRILIVDDVPKNIQVLGSILLKENYNITFAYNGNEAVKIASSNELDLILLDVMMPGIDGFETCKLLKENDNTKNIPVIFMTALSETTDKVKGFQAGAVDYITKPYEAQEVLARVRTHLTIRKLQKELNERIQQLEIRNKFIQRTFGRYLSDDIVQNLLESEDGIQVGGERRVVTILMADIRGFSAISEKLSPEETVALINNFLYTMTEIILKYEGTIDEFIGDAILVIFGAPIWKDDHAVRAAACALEMQLAMESLNKLNLETGFPELQIGIGINTGEVVVGNIGSLKRAKYGVVGRNVNITSRIQAYSVGNQILISENTFNYVSDLVRIEKSFKVNPKGVKEPINLYELDGIGGEYNLYLPVKKEEMKILDDVLSVTYIIMDEKSANQTSFNAYLTAVSLNRAILQAEKDIPLFSNLKLLLTNYTEIIPDALYSKIIEKAGEPVKINSELQHIEYIIHFTLTTPETKTFFRQLVNKSVEQ